MRGILDGMIPGGLPRSKLTLKRKLNPLRKPATQTPGGSALWAREQQLGTALK